SGAILPLSIMPRLPLRSTLFPYTTLFRSLPLASMATGLHGVALLDAFYRAGAFVFGGGHVVLPLLEEGVVQPGWIESDGFLAGRSEEHTSELQSRENLVCRLLLEKKN